MAHKPRAIIARAEQDALEKLRADTSIVVLPADKGRSTVVLDNTDYIKKANSLLDDRQAYLRCDDEPMRKLLTQLDKTLAEMQANKEISKSVRLAVKPTDAAAPRFYGLPKLHKVDVPLRPMASLRGAPTFNLAKWLFRHLRPLTSGAARQSLQLLSFWNGSGERDSLQMRSWCHLTSPLSSPGHRNGQRIARETV
ncbi:hypothetical protein SprV_0802549500 [Sparganum proliferum]